MVDISTVGIVLVVSVPTRSAMETSRRELSEDVSYGIGTSRWWSNRAWKSAPGGVDTYRCIRSCPVGASEGEKCRKNDGYGTGYTMVDRATRAATAVCYPGCCNRVRGGCVRSATPGAAAWTLA